MFRFFCSNDRNDHPRVWVVACVQCAIKMYLPPCQACLSWGKSQNPKSDLNGLHTTYTKILDIQCKIFITTFWVRQKVSSTQKKVSMRVVDKQGDTFPRKLLVVHRSSGPPCLPHMKVVMKKRSAAHKARDIDSKGREKSWRKKKPGTYVLILETKTVTHFFPPKQKKRTRLQ